MPSAHHLPSPSSTVSLSPRQNSSHDMTRHSSRSSSEEGDDAAKSALEIRREKNRIKQRNLRQRRANQMADLESTVTALRSRNHDLEDRLHAVEAREASLQTWVRELENSMISQGHREQADNLRRMWGQSAGVLLSSQHDVSSSVGGAPRRGDPLATLANAASTFQNPRMPHATHAPQPYAMRQSYEDDEASSRKRRREDEYEYSTDSRTDRLPSPNRMRISDLVTRDLPLSKPSVPVSVPVLHQPHPYQGWSSLPGINQSFNGYEDKRTISQDARHHTGPNDGRRPMSSSSSQTARTWPSPLQSFDVRL